MAEKNNNYVVKVTKKVDAPVSDVWDALVSPEKIGQWMFGTTVSTDWTPGSEIVWEGDWKGKAYQDKGTVLEFEPERRISYSHFSPTSGAADIADNYHIVTIELRGDHGATTISLTQDNNESPEAKDESETNWDRMLGGIQEVVATKG